MKKFDVEQSKKAQKEYQDKTGSPDFAPSDGVCWSCKRNIYKEIDRGSYKSGISVERAQSRLVTGCPHCNRSYCS